MKKSLARIEKINIPESSGCNPHEEYIPDKEIEELVMAQTGCNLPWSKFKLDNLGTCQSEEDFENYFNVLEKSQGEIKSKPKKCKYIAWLAAHYDDYTVEGDNELEVELLALRNEVRLELISIFTTFLVFQINVEKQVYAYTTSYFLGALGGYLGLFLGGSLLGLLETIEACFNKVSAQRS